MAKFITMSEAAKVLDVSYPTVKRWELSGKLNCTSQKIKGVKHYLEHEITAIKNTGIVASNMGRKKGYSRTLDKVKKSRYDFENEGDVYFMQRPRPCFEYPELLINFYQPARLNRQITIDHLRSQDGS